jgi:predicted amidohydrolase YtcJ
VKVVAGSDCPVEPLSPLSGIEAAVNRTPPEALEVEQAIALYTRDAAYASFEENTKGTITAGKLADLVILEKDPRKVPPSLISRIRVLKTMVGGKIVHPSPAKF